MRKRKIPKTEMTLQKRKDGWWILHVPDSITEYGPYDTKDEAEEDRVGLARTFQMLDADPKYRWPKQEDRMGSDDDE